MVKIIKDYIPIFICIFLGFTQLKVLVPFVNSLVVMIVGLGISFLFYKMFYRQVYLIWMITYFLVLLLNNFIGDFYFSLISNVIEEICVLLFPAAFSYYVITQNKISLGKALVCSFYVLIIYSSITTFIVDMLFPNAVRSSVALLNRGEVEVLNLYYGLGMVTYKFTHALPVIIPALIFAVLKSKAKGLFRLMALLTLVAALLTIYISNATTALLLAILALASSLLISENSNETTFIRLALLIFIVMPLLINSNLLEDMLNTVSSLNGSETNDYVSRLEDLREMSDTGEAAGDLESRMDKYSISLSILKGDIFLGSDLPTGEHSAILDRLACLGLIGWVPYIIYIINIIISNKKYLLSNKVVPYYLIGVVTAILMLSTKNMSGWDMWFMFFCLLPVSLWFYSQDFYEVNELTNVDEIQ